MSNDKWMLITGNNLNPRAWRLEYQNFVILIHDPQLRLAPRQELELIREHTTIVKHYRDLRKDLCRLSGEGS